MWDGTEDKIRITIIRHGATKGNIEKRYCGQRSDDVLCEEGIKGLHVNKEKNLYGSAHILFVSGKRRATESAKIIYPELDPIVIDEFDEIDFGDFEGKNYKDLEGNSDYQKWIDSNGEIAFPGGESKNDYCKKVASGFIKALEIYSEKCGKELNFNKADGESDIAIVAHGGTIMAILSTFAGMNYYNCMVSNGQGYIIEVSKDYPDSMRIVGITE